MTIFASVTEKLIALGLTKKQASIYLAILKRRRATILEISRDTHIQRPTIYENAPFLENLGLIETALKGTKKYLIATAPERILALVEGKQKLAHELMEAITSLQTGVVPPAPIKLYSGQDGAKHLAQAILQSKTKRVCTIGNHALLCQLFSEHDLHILWKSRAQKGIHIDTLYPATDEAALLANTDYSPAGNFRYNRDTRILPPHIPFSVMYTIVDNDVLFWSSGEENFFFRFSSPSYADSMRALFSTLWNISTPLHKKPGSLSSTTQ
jgi:predicted transcriptional regulator